MKAKQILWSVVAAFAALGLASCDGKKEDDPAGGLALNKAKYEMYVGEEYTLKATVDGAEVEATWATSDAAIATVEAGLVKGIAEGTATITATYADQTATCTMTILAQEVEGVPALEEPAAGMALIAVRAPKGTCKGVYLIGGTTGWKGEDITYTFEPVEGTETWFTLTISPSDAGEFKMLPLKGDGTGSGWSYEPDGSVYTLDEAGEILEDKGTSNLTVEEGITIFGIDAWKLAPCGDANPAGTATFTMTTPFELPAGTKVGIVGSFPENLWNPAEPLEMEFIDGAWTAQAEVPAAFQYKYVIQLPEDGGVWPSDEKWETTHESASNINMALDLNAVDVIDGFKGFGTETPEEAQ